MHNRSLHHGIVQRECSHVNLNSPWDVTVDTYFSQFYSFDDPIFFLIGQHTQNFVSMFITQRSLFTSDLLGFHFSIWKLSDVKEQIHLVGEHLFKKQIGLLSRAEMKNSVTL